MVVSSTVERLVYTEAAESSNPSLPSSGSLGAKTGKEKTSRGVRGGKPRDLGLVSG
jgi:hypothetical protein